MSSFAGYQGGEPLPSLLQILNGERPANNAPIRVDFTPGSKSRYSGGGAEVMQQLLMDVTGQQFPELMAGLVLTPVGMTLSTYSAHGLSICALASTTLLWPIRAAI